MRLNGIWRQSIRSRLLCAFALVALPVVITGAGSLLRQPAQYQALQRRVGHARFNLQTLRKTADTLHGKLLSDAARDRLLVVKERIEGGELQGDLAGALRLSIEQLVQQPASLSQAKLDAIRGFIQLLIGEQEAQLLIATDALFDTMLRVQKIQTAQALIVVGMVLVLSSLLSRTFSRPLENLTLAIQAVRRGELGVQSEGATEDEMGEVIRTFNEMSEQLRDNLISRSYLSSILNGLKDGVVVCTASGTIEFCNQAFCDLALLERSNIEGNSIASLLPEYSPGDAPQGLIDLWNVHGEAVPVSVMENFLLEEQAENRFLISLRDERERLRMMSEQDSIRQQLLHSERLAALGTLSGEMAHRLNQPLTSLRLFLQQSRRRVRELTPAEDVLQHTIERCLDETSRASDAVKSILSFTRREPLEREQIDLADLIQDASEFLMEMARQRGVTLTIATGEQANLHCAAEEIRELLFVLVSNAVDAVQVSSEKMVTVGWRSVAAGTELYVEDTGPGIQLGNEQRIFEAFYTTKPNGKGTGLGLSIARKIVADHGGTLSVSPAPDGRGSRFVASFKDDAFTGEVRI